MDRKPSIAGKWGISRTISRRLAKNLFSAHARVDCSPGTCIAPAIAVTFLAITVGTGLRVSQEFAAPSADAHSCGSERFRPSRAACHNWDRRRPDQFADWSWAHGRQQPSPDSTSRSTFSTRCRPHKPDARSPFRGDRAARGGDKISPPRRANSKEVIKNFVKTTPCAV
jgi:hypothetical protein